MHEPGYFADPYPAYARMRDEHAIHHHPAGPWMVFRYDDVVQVLRDPALSVSETNALGTPRNRLLAEKMGAEWLSRPNMPKSDPPVHTKLRRTLSRQFTPRSITACSERVQAIADELITDALQAGDGDVELISEIAHPLPFRMICELMGMPPVDDERLILTWTGSMVATLNPFMTGETVDAAVAGQRGLAAFLTEIVEWKADHLGDDLLSALITGSEGGEALSPLEVTMNAMLLLVGGHETTVNAIGNGVLALLRNREQWDAVRERPDLIDNVVEELLRYDNTIQLAWRTTPVDYEVDGVVIPQGNHVVAWVASANRDERHFGPSAAVLDVARRDADEHASFGGGAHLCLGAWLARLELRILVQTIVDRYPATELVTTDPTWGTDVAIRGVDGLVLRMRAA